jgi:hypothetical protein
MPRSIAWTSCLARSLTRLRTPHEDGPAAVVAASCAPPMRPHGDPEDLRPERQPPLSRVRPVRGRLVSGSPDGIRTRATALRARNRASFDSFRDLSIAAEICCD